MQTSSAVATKQMFAWLDQPVGGTDTAELYQHSHASGFVL